ncbi:septum site-determining protein MinC [Muricomes intestini]|jgi:septum site-determining protein MinC|uniref:Probable septum site-determining protein MinC n=1 Tax=Muricomes intestini TaxID=1796634 RepID=A0A4R3KHD3_9FIRM|nr:septum site-determining protein MinC [Muricomes intestini]TCS82880.1 septum site-determining protein MinC [Muricomes intestini]HAX51910.1 septum formation inhibitor [Lachnospiraceae bacterium]HCR84067.1 septum formation inhibitor [Lachnospiraceae bacterium]
MDKLVRIKSCRYGIEVHLNPEVPFDVLLEGIASKFSDSARFFEGSKMAVTFLDRKLSSEQEKEILELITEITEIDIVCVIDCDEDNEMTYKSIVENTLTNIQKKDGQFYRGTLRKRQVLESDASIIILGDVEQGARVIAKGNVVIVGSLYGSVHAGAAGNKEAYIVSLTMQPKRLRIGDIDGKRQIIYQENTGIKGPKIAVVDGSRIYVDPLID